MRGPLRRWRRRRAAWLPRFRAGCTLEGARMLGAAESRCGGLVLEPWYWEVDGCQRLAAVRLCHGGRVLRVGTDGAAAGPRCTRTGVARGMPAGASVCAFNYTRLVKGMRRAVGKRLRGEAAAIAARGACVLPPALQGASCAVRCPGCFLTPAAPAHFFSHAFPQRMLICLLAARGVCALAGVGRIRASCRTASRASHADRPRRVAALRSNLPDS
jgi:hypothetical protein